MLKVCSKCGKEYESEAKGRMCPDCIRQRKADDNRKRYERLKAARVCVQCRKPLKDTDRVFCEECKQRKNQESRKDYKWYADRKICPICHKNKLYNNMKTCEFCRVKSIERYFKRRLDDRVDFRKKDRESKKAFRNSLIERGICTVCQSRPATKGYVTCQECRTKQRETVRIARGTYANPGGKPVIWKDMQLCPFCGAELKPGKRCCEKHYNMLMEKCYPNLEKYRKEELNK